MRKSIKIVIPIVAVSIIVIIIISSLFLMRPEYQTDELYTTIKLTEQRWNCQVFDLKDNTELDLHYELQTLGTINIYFFDETNFAKYTTNMTSEALVTQVYRNEGDIELFIQNKGRYYLVFINSVWPLNPNITISIEGTATYPK